MLEKKVDIIQTAKGNRGFSVKMMCRTLGVARSSYYASKKRKESARMPKTRDESDANLLQRIRELVKRYAT